MTPRFVTLAMNLILKTAILSFVAAEGICVSQTHLVESFIEEEFWIMKICDKETLNLASL